MLTGDGGTLILYGRPAGRITAWAMRPAGGGVSIEADGAFLGYWVRAAQADPAAAPRVRLTRTTGYDPTFCGDVASLTTARIVLHRCTECSNVS